MNLLIQEDVETLWLPLITYANTDNKETTRLGMQNEWSTTIKVMREGNITRGGIEVIDEVEIFHGDQNPLVMRQVYTKTFQCQYDFVLYPFDTQTCAIRMDTSEEDLDVVKLIPNKLIMAESTDLTLFTIKSLSLGYTNTSRKKDGVSMKVSLKRKVMNELLTTYLPSILLMIITFATTFFKPFFFEAALSVNLTTMLVMTTIFISKMEGLPPTSATKMIDYWLILCQLVPFAQVVLLTAMEYLREEQDTETMDAITQCDVEKEEQHGPETKEAWNVPNKKRSNVAYVPILMVIGKFHLSLVLIVKLLLTLLCSEKKALPLMVLGAFLVYFGIAASFYFE